MRSFLGLLIILTSVFAIPFHVLAVDYSIENMQINAFLQENGNVHVTEEQTYNFEGKFNGITRTLIPKANTSINNVEATENNTRLDIEHEDGLYKIYRSGKDETVTIQLTYVIKDAVNIYKDVAEFYWPFFDANNESSYEQVDVFVHPPNTTDEVITIGYGAAEGLATHSNDGTAHFAMGKVKSETAGDIRVAYDVTLFPYALVTENKPMRTEILAEQESIKEKHETFQVNQIKLRTIAPLVVGLFSIVLVALLIHAWRKKQTTRTEIDRLYPLPYFVPKEVMSLSATIFYTNAGIIQPEALTAALLDLVRKRYVKQTNEDTFTVVNLETDYAHERLLIDWLFYKIGHDGVFNFSDLTTYTDQKSNHSIYYTDFTAWNKAVQEEVKQKELTESNIKFKVIIGLMSMVVLPFTVFFIIYELFGFMFWSLVLFAGFLGFSIAYQTRTIKGAGIIRDWTEFRKKYIDMSDQDWTELVDDEQKRAFIYGIGINDKHIKDKNKALLDRVPNIQQTEMSPLLFLLIATQAHTHFGQAHDVSATSSSSGGSGAF